MRVARHNDFIRSDVGLMGERSGGGRRDYNAEPCKGKSRTMDLGDGDPQNATISVHANRKFEGRVKIIHKTYSVYNE